MSESALVASLPYAAPCWPLVLLVLLPLVAAGVAGRARLGLLGALLLLEIGLLGQLLLWRHGGSGAVLGLSMGRYLEVHALRIDADLLLGPEQASTLLGLTVLALLAGRERGVGQPSLLLLAAMGLVLMADDVVVRGLGWTGLTLASAGLVRRGAPGGRLRALRLGLCADGALALVAVLGFWSLGGSFSVGRGAAPFVPDEDPAVPLPALELRLVGSPPGTPSQRVAIGPTLSLRKARAQLEAHDDAGRRPLRERLQNKLFLGERLWKALLLLLLLASLLRGIAGASAAVVGRSEAPGTARILVAAAALAAALDVWAQLGLG